MATIMMHLENIISADLRTIVVVSVLCAIACYFVKEYLAQPPMIVFVFPIMVFCGLAAYYMFVTTEQLNPKKIDQWLMWTILASICGTIVGIAVVTILATMRENVGTRQAPAVPRLRPRRPGSASR